MITKIISGGQTGAARAGLDAAINKRLPCGGWCPKDRKAEDGQVPKKYPLQETDSDDHSVRTEQNVKDSDGTIVFTFGEPIGGSALTIEFAEKHEKPVLQIDLSKNSKQFLLDEICGWIIRNKICVINVAGSRESKNPGIYNSVYNILTRVIEQCAYNKNWPKTLNEAVDNVLSWLPEEDQTLIKKADKENFIEVQHDLGTAIRNKLGLWLGNDELLQACGSKAMHPGDASKVIIRVVWERLRDTNVV